MTDATHSGPATRLTALATVVVLVGAFGPAGAVAVDATTLSATGSQAVGSVGPADVADDPGANTSTTDDPGANATASPNGSDEDARTVVVRLREADVSREANRSAVVDTLRTHAETSQADVVAFARNTSGVTVLSRFWLANAVLLRYETDRVSADVIRSVDGVADVHPNFEVSIPEPFGRNRTGGKTLNASVRAEGDAGADQVGTTYGLAQIDAPAVWEQFGTRGGGVTVAVLDTGVDPSHPDIDLYTEDPADPTYPGGWAEFDGQGRQIPGSVPRDPVDHGTHVSGTVAGGSASGQHIGVAPNATLLHGLVLNPDGSGSGSGTFAQIIAGMEWAVTSEADVLSMSLSANGTLPQFVAPVRNAVAADTVVVGSIGNTDAGTSGSPGNVFETVSVGATDIDEEVATFSAGETIVTPVDWGPLAPPEWPAQYVVPDISAPGVAVLSARPGGGYAVFEGTSMAAPHVSGTLALMHAAAPGNPSVGELRTALYETARKPTGALPGQDIRYGRGIVNALDATRQVATPDCVPGDANRDGQVTALDATLVQRAIVGLSVPGNFDATCADASGDGRLSALDATVILRTITNSPPTGPGSIGSASPGAPAPR